MHGTCNIKYINTIIICPHIRFYMLNSSSPLGIAMKLIMKDMSHGHLFIIILDSTKQIT
jgi:hypothetical protein